MKAGWEVRPLGQLCTVVNGGTPKSNVAHYWGGDVNWLTPKDMGQMVGRHIADTPRKITRDGLNNCSARLVPPASVIMSTRAPIGHLAINQTPMAFNQGCRGMVPGTALDPVYLFYFLSANTKALNDLGTGATFKELSASALKAFPIPLPPRAEQRRIVALLDEAFDGLSRVRANAEANAADAHELWTSALAQALGACRPDVKLKALSNVVANDCSLSYGIVQPGDELLDGLPIVRPVDLGRELVTLDGLKRIAPYRADGYRRTELQGGELLLCVRGTTGAMAVAAPELKGANVTRGIVPIRFNEEVLHPRFAQYQFASPHVQEQIKAKTYGAALMQINIGDLRKISVLVPSLDEQRVISDRLDEIKVKIAPLLDAMSRRISDIDTLRQALLQKAFSGELRNKEPNIATEETDEETRQAFG